MNETNGIIDAAAATAAPDQAGEAPEQQPPAAARKVPAPLLAAAGAAALAAVCAVGLMAGAGAGGSTAGNVADPEPAAEAPQIAVPDEGPASDAAGKAAEAQAEISHTWRPVYEEAAAEAKTRVEHVEATYKEVTELETLCNVCKEDVTGHAAEHSEQTGHEGFTTNVPVQKTVVDVPAHDETVTEEPVGTVKRLAGYACACGKSLTVDEARQSGVWSADDEPQ